MQRGAKRDYIPQNTELFLVFARHLIDYVSIKAAEWPHIPSADLENLKRLLKNFEDALAEYKIHQSKANKETVKETQDALEKELRYFINQYMHNRYISNSDRTYVGIVNRDTSRTNHIKVYEEVAFIIEVASRRLLSIDFWVKGWETKAKPKSYNGVVIVWAILDKPPTSTDELIHHTMASRRPFKMEFDEADRGKTVYIALAWQNDRCIRGMWSDIKSEKIP